MNPRCEMWTWNKGPHQCENYGNSFVWHHGNRHWVCLDHGRMAWDRWAFTADEAKALRRIVNIRGEYDLDRVSKARQDAAEDEHNVTMSAGSNSGESATIRKPVDWSAAKWYAYDEEGNVRECRD
jgi:hypothetical protein